MKKIIFFLFLINISFAFSIDAEEILNKFRKEVVGDSNKVITTFKARGRLSDPREGGRSSVFNFYVRKPDMLRMDRAVKASVEKKVIRGNKSWYMLMSLPHPMEFADSIELVRLASFVDPLMVDIFRDSLDAEYIGEDEVEGKPVYVLQAKNKLEETNKYYFDKSNFRLIKREEKTYSMGFPTDSEIYMREFERNNGYLMVKKIEVVVLDEPAYFEFSELKPNMILQKSVFRMPQ